MAGRAGAQDFGATARAKDKIFLHRSAAAWAWPRRGLDLNMPHVRLHRLGAVIMGDVMQRVVSAHWFLSPLVPAIAGVGFVFALILAAYYEGRVKREYRLYESKAGADLFLRPHSISGLRRSERCAAVRAVLPVRLYAAPAGGTSFRGGGRIVPAADRPHQPGDSQHG